MNSLKQRVKKNKVRNSRMNWHDPEEIRQCRKRHLEKPLKEFTRTYQYGYVQYKNYCKECNNKRTQEWRARKKMATEN